MTGFMVRKTTHMLLALMLLWSGYVFGPMAVVGLCGALFVLFTVAHSAHLVPRVVRTPGIVFGEFFFLLGVGCAAYLFLPDLFDAFLAGMLVLAFADPLAALVGKKWGTRELYLFGERRTLEGTATCFVITALVLLPLVTVSTGLLGALMVALVEALAPRGSDNLVLPLVAGMLVLLVA